MIFDYQLFLEAFPQLVTATGVTLKYTFISLLFGTLISMVFSGLVFENRSYLNKIIGAYIYFFRGTPLLVQIFLIYFGAGQFAEKLETIGLWFLFKEAWFCALLALSLNTGAYTLNLILGALRAIPKGELEAAQSLGLGKTQAFVFVMLPRALKMIIPSYGNEVILLLKATSLVSTITIMDLLGEARNIASENFAPIEVFCAAGIIYLLLTGSLTLLFTQIEKASLQTV